MEVPVWIKNLPSLIRWGLVVGTLVVSTFPVVAQERYALLVGIDAYPGHNRLNGCLNDVRSFNQLLVQGFGLNTSHILVLVDKDATRQAILDGI
ncbi:MAG TPA: caspase family protein, partial [Acidobacteriota bacterium]|nr:caspase family protein [Acidobacteriota bacterium]